MLAEIKRVNSIATTGKVVALTFDADMDPYMKRELETGKVKSWYNQELVNFLKEHNIKATMFLTGMWIEQYPKVTRELSESNLFEIANHSYSHPAFSLPCYKLGLVKKEDMESEITKTDTLLKENTVSYKKYFRFPGLCHNKESLEVVNKNNYIVIDGDVHAGDGFQNDPQKIVRNVLQKVHPESIIIFHMMGNRNAPATAKAVPEIIKKLEEKGYTFVKVSELN